jgi:hypothetical protein
MGAGSFGGLFGEVRGGMMVVYRWYHGLVRRGSVVVGSFLVLRLVGSTGCPIR